MDERSLSWLHLLPSDAPIGPWHAPSDLAELLGARMSQHASTLLAWRPTRADMPNLAHARALALINPRWIGRAHLAAIGLPHVRAFAALPSLADARWFMPLGSAQAQLRAWDLYTPYRRRARLQRALARLLARSRACPGDRVVLALPEPSALENRLAAVLGCSDLSIAIASGTPGPQRKVTLQIATPAGQVLAYAKLADRAATAKLVGREAHFLEHLSTLDLRHVLTPRLLYHGPHQGSYLMATAPLPAWLDRSGPALGASHASALGELAMRSGAEGTAALLRRLGQRTRNLDRQLQQAWVDRFEEALAALFLTTDIANLPTTLAHGDFVPWNVRVDRQAARAALFDWEQGQREQLLLWDAFHFETMASILVRRESVAAASRRVVAAVLRLPLIQTFQLSARQVRALYVAYLLDISARWFEQRSGSQPIAADDEQMMRGRLLDRLIGFERETHE